MQFLLRRYARGLWGIAPVQDSLALVNSMDAIFESWVTIEQNKLKKGQRSYLHFDNRIDYKSLTTYKKFLLDPNKIASNPFYPFIGDLIITKRYKKDLDSNVRFIDDKKRPICYASHRDAIIYSWYSYNLNLAYEKFIKSKNFNSSVLAYRSLEGKSNIDFAKEVFDYIKSEDNDCVAITYDVEAFFDSLDHKILRNKWLKVIRKKSLPSDVFNVYKSLTVFSRVNNPQLLDLFKITKHNKNKQSRICYPNQFRDIVRKSGLVESNSSGVGIPQGSSISAVLSNIYMIDFDKDVYEMVSLSGGIYRRYCDDIIVVVKTSELANVLERIPRLISKKYKLKINVKKSQTIFFNKAHKSSPILVGKVNLQYLGFEFNGVSTYIRSASLSKYYRKAKQSIEVSVRRAMKSKKNNGVVYRDKIYKKYTSSGSHNFISYAIRASEIMNALEIRKQVKRHFHNLKVYIDNTINKHNEI